MEGISKAGFKYIDLATCPGYYEHVNPRPEDMVLLIIVDRDLNAIFLIYNYGA